MNKYLEGIKVKLYYHGKPKILHVKINDVEKKLILLKSKLAISLHLIRSINL